MRVQVRFQTAVLVSLFLLPAVAFAETPPDAGSSSSRTDASHQTSESLDSALQCRVRSPRMDKYRYLRALSLDLRGVVPSPEEYRQLEESEDVPEELIDRWLRTEAFGDRVVRWHRKLLWNNLENVQFFTNRSRIRRYKGFDDHEFVYWNRGGADDKRGKRIPCLPQKATYRDDGSLVLHEKNAQGDWVPDTDGSCRNPTREEPCREGYVDVSPYWAPDDSVPVCALDAADGGYRQSGAECAGGDYNCGCGENLHECVTGWRGPEPQDVIKASLAIQVEKLVRRIVLEDRPYLDLFRTNEAFFNGPLVHFFEHLSDNNDDLQTRPGPYDMDRLPDLDFIDDETWKRVTVGQHHAGVLTSPAYLMRFSRNRQRANHFYKKFLCQPFEPPEGGLEIETSGEEVEPDLQKRSGCQYCHSRLEPAAAHWGRWREIGGGYLDPETYPAYDDDCSDCAETSADCSRRCEDHYVTDLRARYKQPYAGKLDAYLFRRKRHEVNVERGPERLAMQTVGDNRLLTCAVRTRAEALLGRSLGMGEQPWLEQMIGQFIDSGYSYREMVKAIVTSSKYRRVR